MGLQFRAGAIPRLLSKILTSIFVGAGEFSMSMSFQF